MMKKAALATAFVLVALYFGDGAMARSRPLGSVIVKPFYAIHQKNGKIEFDYSPPAETDSCVASILPHLGYNPCWYLKGHTTRRIEI